MSDLLKRWLAILGVSAVAAVTGYWYGAESVPETVIHEKGEVTTVTKDHIITKTIVRNPDGTTMETQTDRTVDSNRQEKSSSTASVASSSRERNYYLGVQYWPSLDRAPSVTDLSAVAGRRIFGPFLGTVEIRPVGESRGIAVGLGIEF